MSNLDEVIEKRTAEVNEKIPLIKLLFKKKQKEINKGRCWGIAGDLERITERLDEIIWLLDN